ncbi:dTMP kinase [Pyrobaculum calidifontis]|uniref:Probable thymidylate kinase n=1 Tax=Pyrobaculum calidifontis (strain DSM 21063 / JCM 11548 / VA1) TaxID=410359 RepID=KTHY_PYRCJ|nr:dTMP kinase [Pyrobaculum calidifontis]A3MSE7.1 RecName: Full=Probable thymidylate kinase; AltName: Full=dTMP kinase [Pyrobaculum calidifontis JCM 11548]ABO07564.1 thymidylate kinase [Pyrobaculum calidifontis JCM 11548]
MFIAVEGIDGSGKTTVIAEVAKALPRVYVTREPSGGPIGRLLKEWALRGGTADPHVDALLFAADRVEHYKREIEPKLREGYIVITERYVESSIAYQGAAGVPIEYILYINSVVPRPHLTIILDVDPAEAIKRIKARERLEKFEDVEFLRRVREIYLTRARAEGYPVIDAGRPAGEVAKDVVAIIERAMASLRR